MCGNGSKPSSHSMLLMSAVESEMNVLNWRTADCLLFSAGSQTGTWSYRGEKRRCAVLQSLRASRKCMRDVLEHFTFASTLISLFAAILQRYRTHKNHLLRAA